ncbi:MAG: thioredoxin family protein [Bacteroidota bacterium]
MKRVLNNSLVMFIICMSFISCERGKLVTVEEYVKSGFVIEGPHKLMAFLDYEKELEYAQKVNKPVLLNFTVMSAVSYRKIERQVWKEDTILNLLQNEVVLVFLYLDNEKTLPKEEQYESKITGNKIRTIGQKLQEFQIIRYNTNAQPLYVIQDIEENDLTKAISYTPDPVEYEKWLQDGIDKFKAKQ